MSVELGEGSGYLDLRVKISCGRRRGGGIEEVVVGVWGSSGGEEIEVGAQQSLKAGTWGCSRLVNEGRVWRGLGSVRAGRSCRQEVEHKWKVGRA